MLASNGSVASQGGAYMGKVWDAQLSNPNILGATIESGVYVNPSIPGWFRKNPVLVNGLIYYGGIDISSLGIVAKRIRVYSQVYAVNTQDGNEVSAGIAYFRVYYSDGTFTTLTFFAPNTSFNFLTVEANLLSKPITFLRGSAANSDHTVPSGVNITMQNYTVEFI